MSDLTAPRDSDWIKELELLILRHEEQGVGRDMASMTNSEKWGVYLRLKRLEGQK